MKKPRKLFAAIILLVLLAAVLDLPRELPIASLQRPSLNINLGPIRLHRDLEVHQGLDLVGGSHLVFEADMSKIEAQDREDALVGAREIIARRVDLYGVAEPLIQTATSGDNYRIIVELPGIKDTQEAIELIGQTAQLDFREEPELTGAEEATSGADIFYYMATGLTGKDLAKAQVQFDQTQASVPVVGLSFTQEGSEKFAAISRRNVGRRVAIFLDDILLTAPVVKEVITSGDAVISSDPTNPFTLDEAKNLAIQLNAGALPVPVKVIEQRTVGATLGQDSVIKSLQAGAIGLSLVILFMAVYYGWLGVIADLALVVYGLLTLAIYKLVPITLTLPGLAGFILSVGMAVDANILIFERMKEEERAGRPWQVAMELGFGRAWDSIKDANMATLMTCFVLLNPFEWRFLATSGMARGFALTLGIGVLTSLFTGIVVTRTFLRVLYSRKEKRNGT